MTGYKDPQGKQWASRAEYEHFRARAPRPPKVEPAGHGGMDTIARHPAFGQIRASRVHGGRHVLYGSDFEHDSAVHITITRSELQRGLAQDWYAEGKQLIEVSLSEAQWAHFVSSLNMGSGGPCTIEWLPGETVPQIAALPDRRAQFKAEMVGGLQAADAAIGKLLAAARDGKLRGMKKEDVLDLLHDAHNNLGSHVDFVAKQFGAHVETTVERAKAEVEAYVAGTLQRAGLKALQGKPVEFVEVRDGLGDAHKLLAVRDEEEGE